MVNAISKYDSLNRMQKEALVAVVRENRNVMLLGEGGTGKSAIIKLCNRVYTDKLFERNVSAKGSIIAAPYGMAAAKVEGVTVDSIFAGVSICENPQECEAQVRKLMKRHPDDDRWLQVRSCGILTIDEVSTLKSVKLFILDKLFRLVREEPNLFMGGVRVLLCGDFLQLDAVGDAEEKLYRSSLMLEGKFKVVLLEENMRQSQSDFKNLLSRLRVGNTTPEDTSLLKQRSVLSFDISASSGEQPLHLCGNRLAFDINDRMMKQLDGNLELKLTAVKRWIVESESRKDKIPEWTTMPLSERHPQTMGRISEQLDDFCKRDHVKDVQTLVLRVGSRVMINKNLYDYGDPRMKNGRIGTVVDMIGPDGECQLDHEYLLLVDNVRVHVRFDDDDASVVAMHPSRQVYACMTKTSVQERCEVWYMPLVLAWATTVYKAQGSQVDKLVVHCNDIFHNKAFYVALSRCRTLEGLRLVDFKGVLVDTSSKADIAFYYALRKNANAWDFAKGLLSTDLDEGETRSSRKNKREPLPSPKASGSTKHCSKSKRRYTKNAA
ncbi:hypothetical protein CYMTET_55108 [Cymbomonas tetramitiformis]|uniref:ATP-dependent DNA helicase n=1 Tax=Cymbomonas tetramitiformis TaxID=36881 RepID=A0AAE0BDS7_9CHLO|nr:hypothetical protein CYMTET_55108 [Cymbomonas tetramitiformis]